MGTRGTIMVRGQAVRVEWLSSLGGGKWAELGGEGMLVTQGTDGVAVRVVMQWIT